MPAGRSTKLIRDTLERGVRIRADGTNGRQANDHNQRQHHGVLDRGRTVFRDEETLHLQSKTLNSSILSILGVATRTNTLYKLTGAFNG